jgi:GrpB-like predicted nucleotidyltransferase (UPF0157 family)
VSRDTIEIIDPDPAWADEFRAERERIVSALGGLALAIEHYGSTAVPGVPAKPTIDVMIAVRNLDDAAVEIDRLQQAGYERRPSGDLEKPRRLFLVRYHGARRIAHLALIEPEGDYWHEHLAFRDALRTDAALAGRYAELKRELAERFRDDRVGYTDGKTVFVEAALRSWHERARPGEPTESSR